MPEEDGDDEEEENILNFLVCPSSICHSVIITEIYYTASDKAALTLSPSPVFPGNHGPVTGGVALADDRVMSPTPTGELHSLRRTFRVLMVPLIDDPGGSVDSGRGRTRRLLEAPPLFWLKSNPASTALDTCPSKLWVGPLPSTSIPALRTVSESAVAEALVSATKRSDRVPVLPSQCTLAWYRRSRLKSLSLSRARSR